MPDRALILAIENYPQAEGIISARLEGVHDAALAFYGWLRQQRGLTPENIFVASDGLALPADHPRTVKARDKLVPLQSGASRPEIIACLRGLLAAGTNTTGTLFVFCAGHGFTFSSDTKVKGVSYLLTADYVNPETGGDAAIDIDLLQLQLARSLSGHRHFHFVDACRNQVSARDMAPVSAYPIPFPPSNNGEASSFILYSARYGGVANADSRFSSALVRSLAGEGYAKEWVQGELWVTFDGVWRQLGKSLNNQFERTITGAETGDICPAPAPIEQPCTIRVELAEDMPAVDALFHVAARIGKRTVAEADFAAPGTTLLLEPSERPYTVEVSRGERTMVCQTSSTVDMFSPCELVFSEPAPDAPDDGGFGALLKYVDEIPGRMQITEVEDWYRPANGSPEPVPESAGDDLAGDEDGAGDFADAAEDDEMTDGSAEAATQDADGDASGGAHRRLKERAYQILEPSSRTVGSRSTGVDEATKSFMADVFAAMRSVPRQLRTLLTARLSARRAALFGAADADATIVWLTLAGTILLRQPRSRAGRDLASRLAVAAPDPGRETASFLLLVAAEEGVPQFALHSGPVPAWSRMTPARALSNLFVASVPAAPGGWLLSLQLPGAEPVTYATAAYAGHTTLVTTHAHQGLELQQLFVPATFMPWGLYEARAGHTSGRGAFFPQLRSAHILSLAQRAFRRRQPVWQAGFASPNLWDDLLHARQSDPMLTVLAAIDLSRRGDRTTLRALLAAAPPASAPLAADLSLLRSRARPSPAATPLLLDSWLRLVEMAAAESAPRYALTAGRINYRDMWLSWTGAVAGPTPPDDAAAPLAVDQRAD